MYNLFMVPFRVAFFPPAQHVDALWAVGFAGDAIFFVNIFHTLHRGYYDRHGNKVLELASVRRRYMRNVLNFGYPSLTRDLLALLPLDVIELYAPTLRGCLRLNKLILTPRLFSLMRELGDRRLGRHRVLIGKLVLTYTVVVHVVACGWFLFGALAETEPYDATASRHHGGVADDDGARARSADGGGAHAGAGGAGGGAATAVLGACDDLGWRPPPSLLAAPRGEQYAVAVFRALGMVTGLGSYGAPADVYESAFHIVVMVLALLLFAYAIGAVATYEEVVSEASLQLQARVQEVRHVLRSHALPRQLLDRVSAYLVHEERSAGHATVDVLKQLPEGLHADVMHHIAGRLLARITWISRLGEAGHGFSRTLAAQLVPRLLMADDALISCGLGVTEIFFLLRGEAIELWGGRRETPLRKLEAGDSCGEFALLYSLFDNSAALSAVTVLALSPCHCLVLRDSALRAVLSYFPSARSAIETQVRATIQVPLRRRATEDQKPRRTKPHRHKSPPGIAAPGARATSPEERERRASWHDRMPPPRNATLPSAPPSPPEGPPLPQLLEKSEDEIRHSGNKRTSSGDLTSTTTLSVSSESLQSGISKPSSAAPSWPLGNLLSLFSPPAANNEARVPPPSGDEVAATHGSSSSASALPSSSERARDSSPNASPVCRRRRSSNSGLAAVGNLLRRRLSDEEVSVPDGPGGGARRGSSSGLGPWAALRRRLSDEDVSGTQAGTATGSGTYRSKMVPRLMAKIEAKRRASSERRLSEDAALDPRLYVTSAGTQPSAEPPDLSRLHRNITTAELEEQIRAAQQARHVGRSFLWPKRARAGLCEGLGGVMINPDSAFRLVWLGLLAAAALVTGVIVPYRVGYEPSRSAAAHAWRTHLVPIEVACDAVFVVDLLLGFRLAYWDQLRLVTAPRQVLQHYKHTRLPLSAIAALAVVPSMVTTYGVPAWRLPALLRVFQVPGIADEMGAFLAVLGRERGGVSLGSFSARKLRNLVGLFLLMIHLTCCFYGIVFGAAEAAAVEAETGAPLAYTHTYSFALWWTVGAISALGAVNHPQTVPEMVFGSCTMALSLFTATYLIGNVGVLLSNLDSTAVRRRRTRNATDLFVRHQGLSERLATRCHRYLQLSWSRGGGQNLQQALSLMSPMIRADIMDHICRAVVVAVPLFTRLEPKFLSLLMEAMILEIYPQSEWICHKGLHATSLYIILHGTVSVVLDEERMVVVKELEKGSFFGERALFGLEKRNASVQAKSTVDLAVLSARRFTQLINNQPHMRAVIEDAKVRREAELGLAVVQMACETRQREADARQQALESSAVGRRSTIVNGAATMMSRFIPGGASRKNSSQEIADNESEHSSSFSHTDSVRAQRRHSAAAECDNANLLQSRSRRLGDLSCSESEDEQSDAGTERQLPAAGIPVLRRPSLQGCESTNTLLSVVAMSRSGGPASAPPSEDGMSNRSNRSNRSPPSSRNGNTSCRSPPSSRYKATRQPLVDQAPAYADLEA